LFTERVFMPILRSLGTSEVARALTRNIRLCKGARRKARRRFTGSTLQSIEIGARELVHFTEVACMKTKSLRWQSLFAKIYRP
jgi:hypothetical protein